MQLSFMKKLHFYICQIDIVTQKTDGNRFEIFHIIIAVFLVNNKDKNSCFFKKTFLLANISIDIVFGMSIPIFNNVEINFTDWELN